MLHTYLPMKMEQTECSETSAYKIQTPGNYPEENIQRPLIVKYRANIGLRAFDLWWRRIAETCRVSLLFVFFFLGIYISFWHVRGNNLPLMHFDLIQSIRDSDYRYLFYPWKLKCTSFASSWAVQEGPSGCRWTFSYTFDFSDLTVLALTHFPTGRETLYLDTPCNK